MNHPSQPSELRGTRTIVLGAASELDDVVMTAFYADPGTLMSEQRKMHPGAGTVTIEIGTMNVDGLRLLRVASHGALTESQLRLRAPGTRAELDRRLGEADILLIPGMAEGTEVAVFTLDPTKRQRVTADGVIEIRTDSARHLSRTDEAVRREPTSPAAKPSGPGHALLGAVIAMGAILGLTNASVALVDAVSSAPIGVRFGILFGSVFGAGVGAAVLGRWLYRRWTTCPIVRPKDLAAVTAQVDHQKQRNRALEQRIAILEARDASRRS